MIIKKGNILNQVTTGCIIQQVNCQNVMGAGFAKQVMNKYPKVKKAYHALCDSKRPENLLGTIQLIPVTKDLTIINLFTQLNYGNAKKTNSCYTNQKLLESKLKFITNHINGPITAPAYIGCGLAGGNWQHLCQELDGYDITFYELI